MKLEIENLTKKFGDLVAVDDVSMTIEDGEFVTFVGPSGCGKTTTLRCVAGLETPTSGSIKIDGEDMTYASPKERGTAFVFQDYALYPHMTARRNMSFALESTSMSDEEIRESVESTAEMLGIREHLDQTPGELSGGQQQRVALGRSIVRDPKIFLLDEPLSNLDAKLRVQMRAELQQLHQEIKSTTIYVTHDQEEAMTMSDRIAILNDGRLQQIAPPEVAYSQPANEFVAGFIGSPSMNFLDCTVSNGTVETAAFSFDAPDGAHGAVTLGIRPENITLGPPSDDGHVDATVSVFEQVGSFNIVYLDIDGLDDVVAQVPGAKQFEPGARVSVTIDTGRIHLFADDGETVHNPPVFTKQPAAAE
ncbi:ABC transporter ATP-binding protein [Halosimplex amylolyticum]|uniref:ABC transporter ATP-binding protein n=1 Tax=Halosimplex amylolyticum TaxID=3396616 RepID=UPI003F555B00